MGQSAVTTGEPSSADVHVDTQIGESSDTPAVKLKKTNAAFTKLVQLVKGGGKHSPDEVQKMVTHARAHAGGKGKAAAAKAATESRWFSVPSTFAEGEDPPEWIPLLPKPGQYRHPEYGLMDMSEAMNAHLVKGFKEGIYQNPIPVDGEHRTKTSGAMAWIRDVRLNEDGSADAKVEWTERGRAMLADQRYKFISPEWYPEWEDPESGQVYTDVLIGCALTTRPFFKAKSLRALAAGESSTTTVSSWDDYGNEPEGQLDTDGLADAVADMVFDGIPDATIVDLVTKAAALARAGMDAYDKAAAPSPQLQYTESQQDSGGAIVANEDPTPKPPAVITLTEDQARAFNESQEKIRALTEENTRIAAEATATQAANVALSERVAAVEKTARTSRFLAEVEGKSAESGTRWFGETAPHVEHLETLAAKFGEDSAEVKHYVSVMRSNAVALQEAATYAPQGRSAVGDSAGAGPLEKLNAQAAALREKRPELTLEAAFAEVAIRPENGPLYRQYTESLKG